MNLIKTHMAQKERIQIRLDETHVELLEDLQPYFGNSLSEVARNLILRWIENNIGSPHLEKLREKGAVKS